MESINFVHDVNVLRKTLKSVYSSSADLKALNGEEITEAGPGNCRVQVLPVCWRHLLEFPKRKEKKVEHDIGDTFDEEDDCEEAQPHPVGIPAPAVNSIADNIRRPRP